MIYRLFLLIFGYSVFTVRENALGAANLIISSALPCFEVRPGGETLSFKTSLLSRRKIVKTLSAAGLRSFEIEDHGLPGVLMRYRTRWGIAVGLAVFAATVLLSSRIVWQINVIGNETIDDETIISDLREAGFGIGSYIPSVKVKLICNEYMRVHDDVSWMSINIIGTCADVRVREALAPEEKGVRSSLPSSIIAARDGFIERIELKNGQIIINSGTTVRKGQTIISGALEGNDGSFRLVRSEAKVFAKTIHSFSVTVPLEQTESPAVPEDKKSYSLVFFQNTLGLLDRSSSYADCTPETSVSYLSLPGGLTLPVGLAVTTFYSHKGSVTLIDEEKAEKIAREKIAQMISAELKDADVLSVSRDISKDGSGLTMTAHVCCIEDIAIELPIVGN